MATRVDTHNHPVIENQTTVRDEISELDREVGAAFIASGIGSFVLALMIVLTEMKAGAGLKSFLNFVGPVGPLSGKTTVAVIAFVVSWVAMHFAFKTRAVTLTRAFIIAMILIVLSVVFSFPPVFDIFAG
ncbi:MAG: hypothetical protein GC179_21610 [Anaerolineaceae bacterium]|nr:hypothetical protein [Anaerolineaceae bacterium]